MAINLGANPLYLILLSLMELLFIFIPAIISSRFTKKSIFIEIKEMGFSRSFKTKKWFFFAILSGLAIGVGLILLSGFLLSFIINYLLTPIFGLEFVQSGLDNAISTLPYNPTIIETVFLVIIQIIIVAPCEEAFFRGFLIIKFSYKINLRYAILFSSLIFTFYHLPFFLVPFSTILIYFPYYFIIGSIFALTFISFKYSLIPCLIAHSFFNILILLI